VAGQAPVWPGERLIWLFSGVLLSSLASAAMPDLGCVQGSQQENLNAASACQDVQTPLVNAGEDSQQGTLAKSLLTSSLLCQGTAIISQDAIQEPSLARFVATVVHFRKTYASLLQPAHFTSSRELRWHGATTGWLSASRSILVT